MGGEIEKCMLYKAPLVAQKVKNLPTMPETLVLSLGSEDPLEKGSGNPPPNILA